MDTIDQILRHQPTAGRVTVAGRIVGIHRWTNKARNKQAIIALADGPDDVIEVVVYPKTYPAVADLLVDGAEVAVTGWVNAPDGEVGIIATALTATHQEGRTTS